MELPLALARAIVRLQPDKLIIELSFNCCIAGAAVQRPAAGKRRRYVMPDV